MAFICGVRHIQAEGKKLLEKNANRAVSCKALLGCPQRELDN